MHELSDTFLVARLREVAAAENGQLIVSRQEAGWIAAIKVFGGDRAPASLDPGGVIVASVEADTRRAALQGLAEAVRGRRNPH